MASITKNELVKINSALSAENAALRAEISTLRVQRVADAAPAPAGAFTTHAEARAWARAEAMRTGKPVRVPAVTQ